MLMIMAGVEEHPRAFTCEGLPPAGQRSIRFSVMVGFGMDGVLTVLGPDGKPTRDYWSDIAPGEMSMEHEAEEPMVWTLVTGGRATLVGFGVRSDGSLFALTIRSARGPSRPFTLFDSRNGQVLVGECRG